LASIRARFHGLERSIKSASPGTIFYDTNFFCDEAHCRFKIDGMPIFRDEFEHISEYASKELIERFSDWAKVKAPQLMNKRDVF
jgi:hypothetical protein